MDVTLIGRVVACTEREWDAKTDPATGEVKSKAGSFRAVHLVQRFDSAPVEVRVLDQQVWGQIRAGGVRNCRIEAELRTFSGVGEKTTRESLTLLQYTPMDDSTPNGKAPAPAAAAARS